MGTLGGKAALVPLFVVEGAVGYTVRARWACLSGKIGYLSESLLSGLRDPFSGERQAMVFEGPFAGLELTF